MLDRFHAAGEIRVFDACQADGVIWKNLRDEYGDRIASYWGVDLKPKRGRLKVDSIRVLQSGPMQENVIDIDTYGMPWKHFEAACRNLDKPTTIFLTMGMPSIARNLSHDATMCKLSGCGRLDPQFPLTERACWKFAATAKLSVCCEHTTVVRAVTCRHVNGTASLQYIGVRVETK